MGANNFKVIKIHLQQEIYRYRVPNLKTYKLGTLPKFDFIRKKLLDVLQIGELIMKKDILSNIKNSDALESFFDCITSCSINSEGVDCTTACYAKHLEPANVDYPLNFL